jgi:hypothetical protein
MGKEVPTPIKINGAAGVLRERNHAMIAVTKKFGQQLKNRRSRTFPPVPQVVLQLWFNLIPAKDDAMKNSQ